MTISKDIMVMEHLRGMELILGGSRDPVFGPVVMFGLGGVMVELMEDVQFRVAPLSMDDALDMISAIKGAKVLDGYRGSAPVDRDELARLIVLMGDILMDNDRVEEVEINPLIAGPNGIIAVDARMRLADLE